MKNRRFIVDLEERVGLIIKDGILIKRQKVNKQTRTLYTLGERLVEIVVENYKIKSIEYIQTPDTDRLASYVTKREFDFLKRELCI